MMNLPKYLNDEIWEYCRVNSITNIDDFVIKLVKQGFTMEKYGATPQVKETIIEKIVEVPVEKIVEKIIEIPTLSTELSPALASYQEKVETLTKELNDALFNNAELNKQLAKNKRDIYGER